VEDVFREVSEYEEGQPLKAVDWRRTARMDGELYVKKFDRVNRLRILFLVEVTKAGLVGSPPLLDSVFDAVMAVTKAMVESGDIVTVRLLGITGGNTVTVYNTAGLEGAGLFPDCFKTGSRIRLGQGNRGNRGIRRSFPDREAGQRKT
jgi:hypothetical protein